MDQVGSGADVRALHRERARLEFELNAARWHPGLSVSEEEPLRPRALLEATRGLTTLSFVASRGSLHCLQSDDFALYCHHLGPAGAVGALAANLRKSLTLLAHRKGAGRRAAVLQLARHQGEAERLFGFLDLTDPARDVIIVPSLHVSAMPWGCVPALAARSVTVVPSLSSWTRADRRPVPLDTVFVAAGPGLAGAAEESDSVASVYPGAVILPAGVADSSDALAAMARADLGHFCAHGNYRADRPLMSSLRMADGPLTAYEIASASRVPTVLVLASCHFDRSVDASGLAIGSMLLNLRRRGCRSVVGSVAAVRDDDSVTAMTALHRELRRGVPVPAALAAVRQSGNVAAQSFVSWGS